MESEIEDLISEGWKPRIKTKGNRKYITVRKGNKEKSLGPYTDALWAELKPADPWATPEQLSKLEKRIFDIDRKQRKQNTDFNALIFKKVKQLEEAQQKSNSSLIMKKIIILEEMRQAILLSARRRLRGVTACMHIDKNGVCNVWYWNCKIEDTPVYLRPMKMDNHKGKIVYRVRVIDNPLICSACPSYRRKS